MMNRPFLYWMHTRYHLWWYGSVVQLAVCVATVFTLSTPLWVVALCVTVPAVLAIGGRAHMERVRGIWRRAVLDAIPGHLKTSNSVNRSTELVLSFIDAFPWAYDAQAMKLRNGSGDPLATGVPGPFLWYYSGPGGAIRFGQVVVSTAVGPDPVAALEAAVHAGSLSTVWHPFPSAGKVARRRLKMIVHGYNPAAR